MHLSTDNLFSGQTSSLNNLIQISPWPTRCFPDPCFLSQLCVLISMSNMIRFIQEGGREKDYLLFNICYFKFKAGFIKSVLMKFLLFVLMRIDKFSNRTDSLLQFVAAANSE